MGKERSKMKIEYHSNNSGGYWWLKDEDWKNLEAAGWDVDWVKDRDKSHQLGDYKGGRWLGALATSASKECDNPEDAINEWQNITGQSPSDEGCNCCGPPHSFSYEDDNGNYHYSSVEVIRTELRWF